MLRLCALLMVVCAVACPAAVAADVRDDNPAAAALGPGQVWVFARAGDGTIVERHQSGGTWTPWAAIPGLVASSGPAVVEYQGTLQLFARGPGNGEIWHASMQDGRWSPWVGLPRPTESAPAVAVRRAANVIDVVVRGTDNAAWVKTLDPTRSTWTDWTRLGGNFTHGLAITSWTSSGDVSTFDVFGRDTVYLRRVWWTSQAGPDFANSPFPYGGTPQWITGAPAAISRAYQQFDVFARGSDNGLYQLHYEAPWSAASPLQLIDPAPLESSPAVVTDHPSRVSVVARSAGELRIKTWNALPVGAWSGWSSLGAVPATAPADVPAPAPPAPADGDGDGVLDGSDRCAGVAGPAFRQGCPEGVIADPSIRYQAVRGGIRVRAYSVKATRGARVVVTCSRACKRSVVTGRGSKPVRITRLNGKRLKNGTRITVVASLNGRLTTTVVDRVTRGRRVEGRPLCKPVGC